MSSRPRRNLPNQGDSQADKDYIYYDRDGTDKSTSLLLENNEGRNILLLPVANGRFSDIRIIISTLVAILFLFQI